MKRVFILTLVVLFGVAVSAQAQGLPNVSFAKSTTAAATTPASAGIFGKSSISRAVAKTAGAPVAAPPRASSSFWKGPWPWVIIGGIAAAAIIVAATASDDGTGSGGIYKVHIK